MGRRGSYCGAQVYPRGTRSGKAVRAGVRGRSDCGQPTVRSYRTVGLGACIHSVTIWHHDVSVTVSYVEARHSHDFRIR